MANGTGFASLAAGLASNGHGIALMGRTVAKNGGRVQQFLPYRTNGFTEYLRLCDLPDCPVWAQQLRQLDALQPVSDIAPGVAAGMLRGALEQQRDTVIAT